MKIGANFPAKTPEGPIEDKWTSYKNKIDLVNPANKRLIDIIVVGQKLKIFKILFFIFPLIIFCIRTFPYGKIRVINPIPIFLTIRL